MTHGKFQTILGKSPPSQKMHQPAREISRSNAQRYADQWEGVSWKWSLLPQIYDAVTYAHAPKVNKLTPCHSRHKISRV